jgi:hypothetical protein
MRYVALSPNFCYNSLMMRFLTRSLLLLPLLLALAACSDSVPALAEVRIMPVFEFADDSSNPRMFASLLVRPTSDVERIQTLTLVQPSTGYQWLITSPATMTMRDGTWVTGPRLASEDPTGFVEGDYEVIYTDSSDRVARLPLTLKYASGYLTTTTATFMQLMPRNAVTKIAVYDAEGQLIYFGPRSDDMGDNDAVKRKFPDVVNWREIVAPPDNSMAVLLPLHFADIQMQVLPPGENEPPQAEDSPPDLGDPAVVEEPSG